MAPPQEVSTDGASHPGRRALEIEAGNLSAEALGHREDLERKIADTPASTFFAIKLRIAANGLQPEYPRALETDELNLMAALADAERLSGGVIT